jgi:tetratricopeptide (TPR) repeat protein
VTVLRRAALQPRRQMSAIVALAAALTIAAGCSRGAEHHPAATSESAAAVQAVALPDISRADEAVQAQLREQHAKMTAAVAQAGAPAADRAAAYAEMGKLLMATELYATAERCFQNARALAPGDMRWPYYLAHVARLAGDQAQAATLFEQALALQPDHVPSLVWLAEMHLALSQPARAKPLLVKARSLAPREAAVSYGLGRVALEERDYAAAVNDLEAALALVPSASRVQYPLAMAYRGLGNTKAAEAHLRLRGEVNLPPADGLLGEIGALLKNAAAYETRATQAIDARRWTDAIRELRQAIAIAPGNGFTRLNLGTALYMTGDARGALEQYQAAVRLQPGLAKAYFGLGVIQETSGNDSAALESFAAAVQTDPASAEAQMSLANALRRTGRVSESLPHYLEVLRLNPAVSQAGFGYSMGLVRLGRYKEARDRLERDVQSFPDQPGLAHALARLLAAAPDDPVRDGPRAVRLVEGLTKTQPRAPVLTETMAMALAEVGRFEEAVRWQSEALEAARRAGRTDMTAHLAANLRLYQEHRPCRMPWTNDDPVHYPRPSQ